jgi:hypothetical protein
MNPRTISLALPAAFLALGVLVYWPGEAIVGLGIAVLAGMAFVGRKECE